MNREKLTKLCETIFSWGLYFCLIAGGLAFFGFLTAIIIGGGADSTAQQMATFIQKQYFPVVIRCAAATIGIGLISMYLGKVQALSLATEKKEAEEELASIKHN